jgi:hypothetical protein
VLDGRVRMRLPDRPERGRRCAHQRLPRTFMFAGRYCQSPDAKRRDTNAPTRAALARGPTTYAVLLRSMLPMLTAHAHPQTGALQNKAQTNCPTSAPCGQDGCACPIDNNLDTGVLINEFKGYQCAYPGGACLWDNVRTPYSVCGNQG